MKAFRVGRQGHVYEVANARFTKHMIFYGHGLRQREARSSAYGDWFEDEKEALELAIQRCRDEAQALLRKTAALQELRFDHERRLEEIP